MIEKWTRWEPIDNLQSKYYLVFIIDDEDGLKLIFESNYRKLKIFFENGVSSYIKTDEALRSALIKTFNKNYEPSFYGDWTFFKVENSQYLKWLSDQSNTLSDYYKLNHFACVTDEFIIDIAASGEPLVEHG